MKLNVFMGDMKAGSLDMIIGEILFTGRREKSCEVFSSI